MDKYRSRSGIKSGKHAQTCDGRKKEKVDEQKSSLDLFSTSPTYSEELCFLPSVSQQMLCTYHAPFFAYNKHDRTYGIKQGCCNHWDCPRCGKVRAATEYGRIVSGIRTLAENDQIWFITITCRGKEMTKNESEQGYAKWTNTLLDAWRLQSKRTEQKWAYVQVTERQTRGHPHSHILTTFCPSDIIPYDWKRTRVTVEGHSFMAWVSAHRSEYIRASCVRSGLGEQYDITPAGKIEAVSRYVAKYLFKDNIFADRWPKGWKRVRYSQSFPKLEPKKTDAFVLLKRDDWQRLASVALMVHCPTDVELTEAQFWLKGSDVVLLTK